MELFNWPLFRTPSNWLVVLTMVILALFALHFGLSLVHGPLAASYPAKPSNVTNDK